MTRNSDTDKHITKRWKVEKQYLKEERTFKKSSFDIYQVLTITILASLFSLIMGMAISSRSMSNNSNNYSDAINKFLNEYMSIKDDYYEDLDDNKTMKTALEAILNSLDDYSKVVDDSLSNSLSTKLQGSYQGFGVEIANDNNNDIVIASIIKDSPAEKAELQPLDIIKKLDDKVISNMSTTDFVKLVKESNKAKFNLTIIRDGQEMVVEIERKVVTLQSIATDVYEKNNKKVGYIYVNVFAYNTDKQFKTALTELENKGIDSLIVDLRYNTGGHLTAVENMISEFLDKTHVIYQIQTKTDVEKHYSTSNTKRKYKVAVLVNGYSASASEMFAAAMQEEYGATIIGTTTFGKGTVQEVQDSTSTDIQYKLTTKKWLTPKGKWINKVGVEPNISVELKIDDQDSFTDADDNQLQTAINELTK